MVKDLSAKQIQQEVQKKEWDNWTAGILTKSTLEGYPKREIRRELFFDNSRESVLLYRARADSVATLLSSEQDGPHRDEEDEDSGNVLSRCAALAEARLALGGFYTGRTSWI